MGIFHKLQSAVKGKPTVENQPQWAADAIREATDNSSEAESKLNALLQEAKSTLDYRIEDFRWVVDNPPKEHRAGTSYSLTVALQSAIDDYVNARVKEELYRRGVFE